MLTISYCTQVVLVAIILCSTRNCVVQCFYAHIFKSSSIKTTTSNEKPQVANSIAYYGKQHTHGPFGTNFHLKSTSIASSVDVDEASDDTWKPDHVKPSSLVELPSLTKIDVAALQRGERIQKQSRTGRSGYGFVVVDVDAHPDTVFESLSQIGQYKDMIPTVRSVSLYGKSEGKISAELFLSRFYLKINVVHTIVEKQRLVKFCLDSNRPNFVMRKADGYWFVESVKNGNQEEKSRVYLSANIIASRLVPTLIVDYAASRALPRATKWLQPYFLDKKYIS